MPDYSGLPGPKPGRYWADDDFDRLRAAIVELGLHPDDITAAHAASAIANTPAGGIAATDVQAALNELDGEKAPVGLGFVTIAAEASLTGSRRLVAGAGLGLDTATPGQLIVSIATSTWHVVGAASEPAFVNSWVNNAAPGTHAPARFRRDSIGRVQLQGFVQSGSAPLVFTLPATYRPAYVLEFGDTWGGGVWRVYPDGKVQRDAGSNPASMDGISFPAEQ